MGAGREWRGSVTPVRLHPRGNRGPRAPMCPAVALRLPAQTGRPDLTPVTPGPTPTSAPPAGAPCPSPSPSPAHPGRARGAVGKPTAWPLSRLPMSHVTCRGSERLEGVCLSEAPGALRRRWLWLCTRSKGPTHPTASGVRLAPRTPQPTLATLTFCLVCTRRQCGEKLSGGLHTTGCPTPAPVLQGRELEHQQQGKGRSPLVIR